MHAGSLSLTKHYIVTLSSVLLLLFTITKPVFGFSGDQILMHNWQITHYVPNDCSISGIQESASTAGNSIYVIGDSLTVGMRDNGQIQSKLETNGWEVKKIQATSGIGISASVDKIEEDKDVVAESDVALVGLGTNDGNGNISSKIESLVNKLKEHNSAIEIYWINVAEGGSVQPATPNKNLADEASELNFTVIDWAKEIKDNPTAYPRAVDNIHHTAAGYDARAAWIVNKLPVPEGGTGGNFDYAALPLRDKFAQMLMPKVETEADIDKALAAKVGGIFVNRKKLVQLSAKIKEVQASQSDNPWIVSVDGEGGDVGVDGMSNLPTAYELGRQQPVQTQEQVKKFGEDLKNLGVTMDLAPVADIVSDRTKGVIKDRAFGSTKDGVTAMATAYAQGLRQANILPTFKHFPGHGHAINSSGTLADSHAEDAKVGTISELRNGDMAPFIEAAKTERSAIMVGHLFIPDVNPSTPASVSRDVVKGIIRDELNFTGLVITDDLAQMEPIKSRYSLPDAATAAIKAGNDVALFADSPDKVSGILDKLEAAYYETPDASHVEGNIISAQMVTDALHRISQAKNFSDGDQTTDQSETECTCTVSSQLRGGENKEKAFNHFLDKGYTAVQAAGIVGNMIHESGVEPQRLEGTPGGTITPASEAANSSHGWGVVQWTPAGKFINAVGVDKADDLAVQLDFVYNQLEGTGPLSEKAAGDELKKATTVEDAAAAFMLKYERPTDQSSAAVQGRVDTATSVLAELGSNAASGGSSITGCSSANNTVFGGFSMPLDVSWYEQNPFGFTKTHHDYASADIPVPTGTPVYAIIGGTLRKSQGACGVGVSVDSPNNVTFNYCHGSDGGSVPGAQEGDTVEAGQLIMHSASTGNSTGPHLHVGIYINGVKHCPQYLFVGIMDQNIPALESLPTEGCYHFNGQQRVSDGL